jgi:hypothetical protein
MATLRSVLMGYAPSRASQMGGLGLAAVPVPKAITNEILEENEDHGANTS